MGWDRQCLGNKHIDLQNFLCGSEVNCGIRRTAKSHSPAVNLLCSLWCQPQLRWYLIGFPWPTALLYSGPVDDAIRLIIPDASLLPPLASAVAVPEQPPKQNRSFQADGKDFLLSSGVAFLVCISSHSLIFFSASYSFVVVLYLSQTLWSSLDASGSEKYDQLSYANCCSYLAEGKILITEKYIYIYIWPFFNPKLIQAIQFLVMATDTRSCCHLEGAILEDLCVFLCWMYLRISETANTPKKHLKIN